MYKWLFAVMPGPKWLRCIEMAILALAVVAALFQWGFPWAVETFNLNPNTVN